MLKAVLGQAFWVLCIGVSAGTLHALVRARPQLPEPKQSNVCSAPVPAQPQVAWVKQQDALALYLAKQALFVDARGKVAFQQAHVAGAINLPWPKDSTLSSVPDITAVKARGAGVSKVITYCDTESDCSVSRQLAELLYQEGVRNVAVLEGGMPNWLKNNLPAESGDTK